MPAKTVSYVLTDDIYSSRLALDWQALNTFIHIYLLSRGGEIPVLLRNLKFYSGLSDEVIATGIANLTHTLHFAYSSGKDEIALTEKAKKFFNKIPAHSTPAQRRYWREKKQAGRTAAKLEAMGVDKKTARAAATPGQAVQLDLVGGNTTITGLSGRKKVHLRGPEAARFVRFWEAFGYKKGRAQAAGVWYKLEREWDQTLDGQELAEVCNRIAHCAQMERRARFHIQQKGMTPIWAQGWLSKRRWEDEAYGPEPGKRVEIPEQRNSQPIPAAQLNLSEQARAFQQKMLSRLQRTPSGEK